MGLPDSESVNASCTWFHIAVSTGCIDLMVHECLISDHFLCSNIIFVMLMTMPTQLLLMLLLVGFLCLTDELSCQSAASVQDVRAVAFTFLISLLSLLCCSRRSWRFSLEVPCSEELPPQYLYN
ncbi:unnamed protein product [Polarella glacialis]|uniref:Uncharacterized protein n=1 Tax=Polarella glacialis TaxID=89957 RepID=A0A813GI98_POLGL|nr:unnamed protein product [Polarella glacialis]